MFTLDNSKIKECDSTSRIYCTSYNELASFLDDLMSDDGKLHDWDLSAFGLHLCKFMEQEINSSVMQLVRKSLGIKMPEYYCRLAKHVPRDQAIVDTGTSQRPHYVGLNDYRDADHRGILKQISLGEAYHVMEVCVDNDSSGVFDDYPVLKDARFKEIWRAVHLTRNRIAHSGSVISREEFISFFELFKVFFDDFMPLLTVIKRDLAPEKRRDDQLESPPVGAKMSFTPIPWALQEWKKSMLPLPTTEILNKIESDYYHTRELYDTGKEDEGQSLFNKVQNIAVEYNWLDIPFEENGKYGLRDFTGRVVIPARYDDFQDLQGYPLPFTLHKPDVTVALKNGKVGFVQRYSGKEITRFDYDALYYIYYTEYYCFKKDGSGALGIISKDGIEKLPCILDQIYDIWSYAGFLIRSGDKYGYYSMVFDFCVPPIYDEIVFEDLDVPLTFIIDGISGQISSDGTFYSKEELKKLEAEDEVAYSKMEFIMEYEG